MAAVSVDREFEGEKMRRERRGGQARARGAGRGGGACEYEGIVGR